MTTRRSRPESPPRGFSLIELIVALAVVAVLVAVAAPSYGTYVRRTWVAEALVVTGPAMTAVAEEVMLSAGVAGSQTGTPGPSSPGKGKAPAPPSPAVIVAQSPSAKIEAVWRSGMILVVNFAPGFAEDGATRYSLALAGTATHGGTVQWRCLSGPAAVAALGVAAAGGATSHEPLPPEWAPSGCR